MRFIGDVHGTERRFAQYREIALASPDGRSIQVGDFGAGFMNADNSGITPLPEMDMNHRFIRGNHDDPAVCRSSPNWIPDGMVDGDMFFCGGAESIDKARRIPGVDWWHDEEVSMEEGYAMYDRFADGELRPRIMVTHDLPLGVGQYIFGISDHKRKVISDFSAFAGHFRCI